MTDMNQPPESQHASGRRWADHIADLLVSGEVARLGQGTLLTLQLINQRFANVMNRVAEVYFARYIAVIKNLQEVLNHIPLIR